MNYSIVNNNGRQPEGPFVRQVFGMAKDDDDDNIDQVLKAASDAYEKYVTATNSAVQLLAFPSLSVSSINSLPVFSRVSSSSSSRPAHMSNSVFIGTVLQLCTQLQPSHFQPAPPTDLQNLRPM